MKAAKGTLMMSVSGIRGIVGDTMTPELILKAASAFAAYAKNGTVVVGRDSRPTGAAISSMLTSALSLSGCSVIDLGVVPTPTVQIMVEKMKAAGGIVVSASHNPVEWNAFKLINGSGSFFGPAEAARFFVKMNEVPAYPGWNRVGSVVIYDEPFADHLNLVLSFVNLALIKKRKFKVVLDSVNGAGSLITRELLEKLGCEITAIHCTPDGIFPRGAEPLAENLKDLSAAVISAGADIGFAQDPDADRLAVVDGTGKPVGEELTVSLAAEHILTKKKGPVVVNLSTTKLVEDIAVKHGVKFYRSAVGEINVVEKMRKVKAVIGGEGNGGVISPEMHLGRDSLAGIAYLLEMMAERNKSIQEIISELPSYRMIKAKVTVDKKISIDKLLSNIRNMYQGEKISEVDGLRIDFIKDKDFKGGWVHLRASNTEPVFRIISEAPDEKTVKLIQSRFAGLLKKMG